MNWLLIIVYITFSVGGQVLFKYGTNRNFMFTFDNGIICLSVNWMSIFGGGCYIISFVLFLLLLSRYNLSRINPILVGMTYILTFIASIFILKESVTGIHMLGIIMIFIGVLLLLNGNV